MFAKIREVAGLQISRFDFGRYNWNQSVITNMTPVSIVEGNIVFGMHWIR